MNANTQGTPFATRALSLALASTMLVIATLVLAACGSASGSTSNQHAAKPRSTVYRWGVVGNKGAITQLQLETPTAIAGISGKVVQIATSNSDGYALTSTGAVYGWGVNSYWRAGRRRADALRDQGRQGRLPGWRHDHVARQPDAFRRRPGHRLHTATHGAGASTAPTTSACPDSSKPIPSNCLLAT